MVKKIPFKMGIVIGQVKGDRDFSVGLKHGEDETNIEYPPHAVKQANDYIHENYDRELSLYFGPTRFVAIAQELAKTDEETEKQPRRKSRTRQ